jgi:hypothetical protein
LTEKTSEQLWREYDAARETLNSALDVYRERPWDSDLRKKVVELLYSCALSAYPIAVTVIEHRVPFITNDIVDEKLLKRTERVISQVKPMELTRLMMEHNPEKALSGHAKDAKRALLAALSLLAAIQKRWKEEEAKTHFYRKKPTTKRQF